MRLLLIGAPGAGKGTQAERLAARFGITHISSGDLLRQHIQDHTSIGQTIKSCLDRGDLVPDGVVMDMLRKPVVAAAQAGGYVLGGFPRTVEQARASFPTAPAHGVQVPVPLLEYYADREWMFTVDGAQPPDAVHEDIVACLQGWRASLRGPGQASRAGRR